MADFAQIREITLVIILYDSLKDCYLRFKITILEFHGISRVYSTCLKISYNISIGCKSIFSLFLRFSKMFCRLSDNSIIFSNRWTFDPVTSSDCAKFIPPRNGDICFNFVILSIFNESRISIFSVSGLLLLLMIRNYIQLLWTAPIEYSLNCIVRHTKILVGQLISHFCPKATRNVFLRVRSRLTIDRNRWVLGILASIYVCLTIDYSWACHKISNFTGRHFSCPEFSMKKFKEVNEIWRAYSMTNKKTNF